MKRNRLLTTGFLALTLTATAASADPPWSRDRARYAALDRNRDGVVTQAEWTGNHGSFVRLDTNRDGVLAGAEIGQPARTAARGRSSRPAQLNREEYFRMLDRNRDGWISRSEYDNTVLPFEDADVDGNDYLSWTEWRDSRLGSRNYQYQTYRDQYQAYPDRYQAYPEQYNSRYYDDRNVDSERLSDFMRMDRNRDEYVTRAEWPGDFASFARLDRNQDGVIHISEYVYY